MADLSILKASGMDVDSLPESEQAALAGLDDSELQALAAIRSKLNAGDEVSGFGLSKQADGNVVW